MKYSAFALPLLLLSLSACSSSVPVDDEAMESSSSSSSVSDVMMDSSSSEAAMTSSAGMKSSAAMASSVSSTVSIAPNVTRIVKLAATNFEFTPELINIKKGEKVILRVSNEEGIHGIGIPDMGINQKIDVGASVDIVLDTSKTGIFSFRCTVPCGPGHKEMIGRIIITE